MIENVDNSVGRIEAKLNELGLSENTVVIFFSDNGGLISRFDKIPLHAQSKLPICQSDTLHLPTHHYVLKREPFMRVELENH